MSAPIHIFVDLDDTLFRSRRRAESPPGRRAALGRLVARKADGTPYSYMSPQSERFFDWLRTADRVIPNTARTTEALRRVDLPFVDYRICSLGGVILDPAGTVDTDWDEEVARRLDQLSVEPSELAERLAPLAAEYELRLRVVGDVGRDLHLSARDPARDPRRLAAFVGKAQTEVPAGWRLRPTAHDAAFYPTSLGKAEAQRWLSAHRLEPAGLTIGVGDRMDDADFMSLCDYVIAPPSSDIWATVRGELDS